MTCNTSAKTQELLDANFLASGQAPIDLLSPTENQQVTAANPALSWSSRGVNLYTIEMATDSGFSNVILKKDVSGTAYTVANSDLSGVSSLTTASYFWRVKIAKVTENLQSKAGTFFLVAIPASGVGYAGALYVNGASTASVQVGSKEAPYKKIQSAISAANTLRNGTNAVSMDILVAQGTYTEEIGLIPGISIRGGYESTYWSRNFAANLTNIHAPTDTAVKGNSAITPAFTATTIIDGLIIRGGASTTNIAIALVGASPTISNNTITGGTGSTNTGIRNDSCSPEISNNTITGGTGSFNYGIYNTASSSPVISRNTITGGTGSSNTGIGNFTSSPTISNNTILGGSAGTNNGISNDTSSPTISNNTINGGTAGTIYGIHLGNTSTPVVRNNIIFSSAGSGFCTYEFNAAADLSSFQNNNLFGCAQRYADFVSTGGNCPADTARNCYNLAADLNDNTKTTQGAAGTAAGNEIIDNTGNQLFADIDGADNNIATMADNDWHLTTNAAICNVRGGGLNLSGSFTTDKDGLTRTISAIAGCTPTNTGATNWSIGAFDSN